MSHSYARAAAAALLLAALSPTAGAQPRRRCPDGEHWTRSHCCVDGFDWRPSEQACICVDAASCNPGDPQPNFDAPPTVAPRGGTVGGVMGTAVDPAPVPVAPRGYGNVGAPTRGACPPGMAFVPGGVFQMGSPMGEGGTNEHPQVAVRLSPYCMDRTEVTVAAYRRCADQGVCPPPEGTILSRNYTTATAAQWAPLCNGVRPDRAQHPMNCVDWHSATAYCAFIGGRLPTEAEWEYAARGDDGRIFPWGNAAPNPTLLNVCGSDCAAINRDFRSSLGTMYPGNDGWGATAAVGSFPAGASPFGVMDLSGNVYEWCSDWYVENFNAMSQGLTSNPSGPPTGQYRVIRGGGWFETDRNNVRAAFRNADPDNTRNINLGFRCARSLR